MLKCALSPHVRICKLQGEIIILDLKRDTFSALEPSDANLFEVILREEIISENGCYFFKNQSVNDSFKTCDLVIKNFMERQYVYLSTSGNEKLYAIHQKHHHDTPDATHLNWNLIHSSSPTRWYGFLSAYTVLAAVKLLIACNGLYTLIKKLHQYKSNVMQERTETTQPYAIIRQLCNDLNQAGKWLPFKPKCLEWSVALVLLARRKGIICKLMIGVQNYPFAAHAWVEYNGVVIEDTIPTHELCVILEAP